MRAFLILGISLALAATAFAQQLYRWVDKDGRVHYTQTPPPAGAKNVQKKPMSAGAGEAAQLPYATRIAASNFPVTLYVSDECTDPCKEARALLSKRGVPYRVIEVTDAKSLDDLKRVSGGVSVPVLSVGREVLKGFDAPQYQAALDSAGYPASGPKVAPEVKRAKPEAEAAPEPKQASVPASIPAGAPVTLYVSPECGAPCKDARELLAARAVEFREVQVVLPKDIDELKGISGGNQVPVMTIGTFVMRGFSASDYQAALDAAGYKTPAATKPAPRAAAKR